MKIAVRSARMTRPYVGGCNGLTDECSEPPADSLVEKFFDVGLRTRPAFLEPLKFFDQLLPILVIRIHYPPPRVASPRGILTA